MLFFFAQPLPLLPLLLLTALRSFSAEADSGDRDRKVGEEVRSLLLLWLCI